MLRIRGGERVLDQDFFSPNLATACATSAEEIWRGGIAFDMIHDRFQLLSFFVTVAWGANTAWM